MASIGVKEVDKGHYRNRVVIYINWKAFGMTGAHWFNILGKRSYRQKYGPLYLDRNKKRIKERREDAMSEFGDAYSQGGIVDRDECPGAMFESAWRVTSHVQEVDSWSNRSLGKSLELALRSQKRDGYEVDFVFNRKKFDSLSGKLTYIK